jgi:hypothetical protein
VSKLFILGALSQASFHENLLKQGYNATLINVALDNVTCPKVTYSLEETLPSRAIFLVSALLAFVKNWTRQVPNPMLLLCDEHVRSNCMGRSLPIQ